jgi:hypothetical protein
VSAAALVARGLAEIATTRGWRAACTVRPQGEDDMHKRTSSIKHPLKLSRETLRIAISGGEKNEATLGCASIYGECPSIDIMCGRNSNPCYTRGC